MKAALIVIGVAGATLALILLAWVGGEMHYRNCLTRVDDLYPTANTVNHSIYDATGASFVFANQAKRSQGISSCSRWP